jgi:hypothetical protein
LLERNSPETELGYLPTINLVLKGLVPLEPVLFSCGLSQAPHPEHQQHYCPEHDEAKDQQTEQAETFEQPFHPYAPALPASTSTDWPRRKMLPNRELVYHMI